MAFDQTTRNRLARFVGDARALLTEEFTRQLQLEYAIDPASGMVAGDEQLAHLDDARRQTAQLLRATLEHYLAGVARPDAKARQAAIERIVREQAFTVLNRLCALRMAEARGLLFESVGRGYQSKGFQLYLRLAGPALGETGDAYRAYLFSVFDELAVDLAVLFDRFSPQGRLFPREAVLLALLDQINHPEIEALWAEDETIGWIYQYFNSKEERKAMRDASAAPRNSRELAVRNQFFTPRYVVEFLTDNTLGRIWYEMTQGRTGLVDSCRYLVRRPDEVFLAQVRLPNEQPAQDWLLGKAAPEPDLFPLAHTVNGYLHMDADQQAWLNERLPRLGSEEAARELSTQELLSLLFLFCRQERFSDGTIEYYAPQIETIRAVVRERVRASQDENRSQEELLRQPVFIPHRPLKDPRNITMLDPACGSMHFGLYAFDLFERIYDEAWELEGERGAEALERAPMDAPLREQYPDKQSLLRDVPRLIVERNIHGVDIDPRAVQIAGLSLWLRAQKSWRDQEIRPQDRPAITRSNIVCAEPMPGDRELLNEFVAKQLAATPEDRVIGEMLPQIFSAMELAGEAGTLLKIEDEISGVVEQARAKFEQAVLQRRKEANYLPGMAPERDTTLFDLLELPNPEEFWQQAEGRIYAALRDYAATAENGDGYRRRLFADDAERGFAFIDLCRKRYDVVLMNPPFGELTRNSKPKLQIQYPDSSNDLLAAFVECSTGLLNNAALLGTITSRTAFFLSSFQEWRESILLKTATPTVVTDLGQGVLDSAMVETVAYCLQRHNSHPALFVRLITTNNKADKLRQVTHDISGNGGLADDIYIVPITSFGKIPGSPLSYWVSEGIRKLFQTLPQFEDEYVRLRVTNPTADEFRFLRNFWECPPSQVGRTKGWVPYAKGGSSRKFHYDVNLVAMWDDSVPTYKGYIGTVYRPDIRPASLEYFFRPGIMWPLRAPRMSAQAFPEGTVFSARSQCLFAPQEDLPYYLGLLNSSSLDYLFKAALGRTDFPEFIVGILRKLPKPKSNSSQVTALSNAASLAAQLAQQFTTSDETGHCFIVAALCCVNSDFSLRESTTYSAQRFRQLCSSIELLQRELNQVSYAAYGISQQDQVAIERQLIVQAQNNTSLDESEDNSDDSTNEREGLFPETRLLVSWVVGLLFGRWDIRYATGERAAPELPDPFAPLPVCPPGMLQNAEGLPATPTDVPSSYPLRISWPGILVDDEGHPEDVEGRVREALRVIWGERAEAIEQESCEILGVRSLREYFRKPALFFADHLARYSKSRRQAPIYWPLSTRSGEYTLWLYYHRLTDQTLYSCINDFVEPKLGQVAEQAAGLRGKAGRSAKEEKELERLTGLEQELKDFRDELLRVAAFWKPNLNDGVQITAAPLWQLFAHKPWQKKLRETWASLEAGDYDWAHLSYSIWPERVRAKCRADKSLAIAHDLEALYVAPPASAAKKGRGKKAAEVENAEMFGEGED